MLPANRRCGRRRAGGVAWRPAAALALASGLMAACGAPSPDVAASVPVPAAFRESGGWTRIVATPGGVSPNWWQAFGDPTLDRLELVAQAANPSIASAQAAHREAQAALAESRAALWPTLSLDAGLSRQREASYSARRNDLQPYVWNLSQAGMSLNWTPDLWGVARDDVAAARALEAAAKASEVGVRLATYTLLAANYFELRQIDADLMLRRRIRALAVRRAAITRAATTGGTASRDDLVRARALIDQQDTRLALLERDRVSTEHALAVLTGTAPAEFSVQAIDAPAPEPLAIGPTLPSELLRQRPDIVQALRRVDAADASLKAARGAFFPSLTLGGTLGAEAVSVASLLSVPTAIWSIGPALAAPLLDGGLRAARVHGADAARERAIADYRVTVLAAFQEVEDLLAALQTLRVRDEAARAFADKADALARSQHAQYQRGLASLLDDLLAQQQALEAKLAWQDDVHERLDVQLSLVKALGGGSLPGLTP
ncbi:efflux transporter outer membrane subunit [Burkholderia gladioli]|uniref:efflux transporter outer membrane subunit n=1 Tax=Burkholderia gladioli TaxID=28095 RepID=UPI00163F1515|nr:efflux transporter outer membrane subunit [Burkholderia gladioli]